MAEISKVRYTHDAIIDEIIANPAISQGELSVKFGFTQTWISIIVNSDAFKERLAERKGELVDPKITASIEARLESVAKRSLDKLLDRLDSPNPLKPMELVAMAKLGVGERTLSPAPVQNNNLYVVQLPSPASDSKLWLQNARGRGEVVDISHSNPEP